MAANHHLETLEMGLETSPLFRTLSSRTPIDPSFLCRNANCNVSAWNPNFEVIPLDVANSPGFHRHSLLPLENIEIFVSKIGIIFWDLLKQSFVNLFWIIVKMVWQFKQNRSSGFSASRGFTQRRQHKDVYF